MEVDAAFANLKTLRAEMESQQVDYNEADTRAKIIDRLLKQCLGWPENSITRETRVDEGYLDYQLLDGKTPLLVVEAKRVAHHFDVPDSLKGRMYKLSGAISTTRDLLDAMDQARLYCNDIGCRYGAVFNGTQVAVFPAVTPGKRWTEGYCIVFYSLKDIQDSFGAFWDLLACERVRSGSLVEKLEVGRPAREFEKPLSRIHNPNQSWARDQLYTHLQPIAGFMFSELLDEARAEVLKECYVFERSNRSLTTEFEEYFVDKLLHFAARYRVKDIFEREKRAKVFEHALREATERRAGLILLMGGVGCGKSTFLQSAGRIGAIASILRSTARSLTSAG